MNTTQLQDEIVRLQIRISELERENSELKGSQPDFLSAAQRSPTAPSSPIRASAGGPPPPPMGGLPPPPPPLMAKALGIKLRKPKTKMRGLFWVKLRKPTGQNLQHSLWDQVQALPPERYLDDQLCSNLEEGYSTVERKTSARSSKTGPKEPRYIEVLDSKKATNLSIQYNGLPVQWLEDLEELRIDKLGEEIIEQLKAALPSKEELNDIETASANWPGKPLRIAEEFLLKLGSVSWIQERLVCWAFLLRAQPSLNDLRYRCDLIRSAVFELRLESSVSNIAQLILTTGNFLNSGTARGDAYGFSYSLLSALADTKSNSRESNLLQFIGQQARSRNLLNSDLGSSIELFNSASRFVLQELDGNLGDLEKEHTTCLKMLEHIADRDPTNPVAVLLAPTLLQLSDEISALRKEVNLCRNDFNELLAWLGVTVAEMPSISSADFFILWGKFFTALMT